MWCLALARVVLSPDARWSQQHVIFSRSEGCLLLAHAYAGARADCDLTLALGIGANAAIFTLVRGVLLKPLVNRDENRLIYIRQSSPGTGDDNAAFSVPEIQDLRASVKPERTRRVLDPRVHHDRAW